MKSFLQKTILLLTISAAPFLSAADNPKALVLLMDGARADVVFNMKTPVLQSLLNGAWQDGYNCNYVYNMQTAFGCEASSSGNHVSMMTGVAASRHNVLQWLDSADYTKTPAIFDIIAGQYPDTKMCFTFIWKELPVVSNLPALEEKMMNNDQECFETAREFAARPDADLIWWVFDGTDWEAHSPGNPGGFYPYSAHQQNQVELADKWLGDVLNTITSRPDFANEDWMIIVTSDHGGYGKTHGLPGGHSQSPLTMVISKEVNHGIAAGQHNLTDIAVTLLDHFNVNYDPAAYDGSVISGVQDVPAADLARGLEFYWDCESPAYGNIVPVAEGSNINADEGLFGNCISFDSASGEKCSVVLEGSRELDGNFSISMWVKPDNAVFGKMDTVRWITDESLSLNTRMDKSDITTPIRNVLHQPLVRPVLLSTITNSIYYTSGMEIAMQRLVNEAQKPGFVFTTCRDTGKTWIGSHWELPNAPFLELGPYDYTWENQWVYLCVTVDDNGTVLFYYGTPDGTFYNIAGPVGEKLLWNTGADIRLGSDAAGCVASNFHGDVDDIAIWNRGLTREEAESIYRNGLAGKSLLEIE